MTAPYRRTDAVDVLGNHERRVSILEAVGAVDNTPTYYNPVMKYSMLGDEWSHYDDFGWQLGFYDVTDTTIPGGMYITNDCGSTGDYMIFGAPIGPFGSLWGLDFAYLADSKGGDVVIEFQTQPITYTSSLVNPQMITPPDPGGTWITFDSTLSTYRAAPSWTIVSASYNGGLIVPYGADGEMATTLLYTAPTPPLTDYPGGGGSRAYNGGGDGSVMWYFRFRVLSTFNSGNVSGCKNFTMRSIQLRRYVADGNFVF